MTTLVNRSIRRPYFQVLCDVVEKYELQIHLEPTGKDDELFIWVTDGAQGKTGSTALSAEFLDDAAMSIMADLVDEGFH